MRALLPFNTSDMKLFRIVLTIVVIVLLVIMVVSTTKKKNAELENEPQAALVEGCYVSRLQQDVYTLEVQKQEGTTVEGRLAYDNFEKDSSSGTFRGTYEDGILLAEYEFSSEGMDSVRQVIFKKTAEGFYQGFGPVNVEENRESLVDTANVVFGQTPEFIASPCE